MLILLHNNVIISRVCGRRIMANMPAFQASDASSILAARTKEKILTLRGYFFFGISTLIEPILAIDITTLRSRTIKRSRTTRWTGVRTQEKRTNQVNCRTGNIVKRTSSLRVTTIN